jgi:hypothetical protein
MQQQQQQQQQQQLSWHHCHCWNVSDVHSLKILLQLAPKNWMKWERWETRGIKNEKWVVD